MGPIEKLRLLYLINKYINLWSKWEKMTNTSTTTKIFQVLGLIITGVAMFGNLVPAPYAPWVAIGMSTIQAIQAQIAHRSNPDGTLAPKPVA